MLAYYDNLNRARGRARVEPSEVGSERKAGFHVSLDAGVVRMSERHIHSDPPAPEELQSLALQTRAIFLESLPAEQRTSARAAIAVAGTATSAAAIAQELDPYDPDRVDGFRLTLSTVELLLAHPLDVVLSYDVAPRIGLSFAGEFALKTCVLMPRGHRLSGKRAVSLSECAEYPLILPDETQYLRGILDQMFHEVGVKPAPFIATNSYALMRDLVDDGLGIGHGKDASFSGRSVR